MSEEEIFEYPKWMECQWRREPCNRTECPLCFRLMKQEQKHKLRGEDSNDMKVALNDVAESFEETKMMIKEDAEKLGIDLDNIPEVPDISHEDLMEHPLQKRVHAWVKKTYDFIRNAYDIGSIPFDTEEWQDLEWYHTMLSAKLYRQLNNLWDMEHIDQDRSDYVYTKDVIEEIVSILKNAFQKLLSFDLTYSEKSGLQELYNEFLSFERDLLSI